MKVVLDTNVFVSGIFWNNDCSKIISLWNESKIELVSCIDMLKELKRVLHDFKIQYPKDKEERLFSKLVTDSSLVLNLTETKKYIDADPDDDKFVQCAISAKAEFIVSQDKHLLGLGEIEGIKIVTPKDFLVHYSKQ
ncbi:MAG: putative toxin-antitoxin system toxin component, PIN family [archaeon]